MTTTPLSPPLTQVTHLLDEDTETVRLRVACDRCHSQKLRCPKAAGTEKCNRCSKAQTPCVFSPFRQKKEPCNVNPSSRASMNAQLARLEERIGTVTKSNRSAMAKFDPKVGAKRKRTVAVQENCDYQAPNETTAENLSTYSDSIVYSSDTTGLDWVSTAFPMFNDFEQETTFDDFDVGMGNIFPAIDFGPPYMSDESQGPKTREFFQLPTPPSLFFDNEFSTPKVDRAPATLTPRFTRRKSRTLEIGWENHISTVHPHSEKHLIRQLSQLSIGLYDHISTIPPQSIHDKAVSFGAGTTKDGSLAAKFTSYSPDEIFKLTQDLIDIYPVFLDTFLRGRPSSSESPSCYNVNARTPSAAALTPRDDLCGNTPLRANVIVPEPKDRHDHASILLLLSCHLRVIDIYDELFKHIAACMRDSTDESMDTTQMCCPIPTVSIGTYTPPPSSSVPMQMMLLVHLAAQLADNAGELASHLRGPLNDYEQAEFHTNDSNKDEAAMLSLAMAEKVKGRASDMSHQLGVLRTALLTKGRFA